MVLLGAALSCSSRDITSSDDPITSDVLDAWSGGTLDLRSHAFAGADTVPVVLLGNDTLAVSRPDTFAVRVQLPDTTTGVVALTVVLADGSRHYPDAVTVHGFTQEMAGPSLAGLPQRTPDGQMFAIGIGGAVRVMPWSGSAQSLLPIPVSDPSCNNLTPGFSLVPGVVVTSQRSMSPPAATCGYYAWSVAGGTPVLVDSMGVQRPWSMAYLGPNRWLIGAKQGAIAATSTTMGPLMTLAQEPDEFVADPAGHYLVPNLSLDRQDIPVFSTTTSTVAYRIAGLQVSLGAGFTAGGDTLFLAARDTVLAHGSAMLAINPATGQVLASGALDAYAGGYLVVPETGRWMYLTGAGRYPQNPALYATTVAVQVIDRRTLKAVAHLQVPLGVTPPALFDILVPVMGPANKLYIVAVHAWDTAPQPTRIYVFDLIP